jgi:hypothetical protein
MAQPRRGSRFDVANTGIETKSKTQLTIKRTVRITNPIGKAKIQNSSPNSASTLQDFNEWQVLIKHFPFTGN